MVDIAQLQRYSLFGGLLAEDIEQVRPYLELASWHTGEYVIKEGEANGRLHFVLDGLVRVSKRNRTLVDLGEGETFGEVELLDVMPAVASIVALRPTKLAMISNRSLHSLYKSNPALFAMLVMNLARDLARRLRRMDELACSCNGPEGETRKNE
jgi:CRP/FNR family transcriptional regulator, cyclic AMP receptor protein